MDPVKVSEKKQTFDGKAYYLCGQYFQRKGVRLHRKVWEHHNGPIPVGCDIHHIDGDRSNNSVNNLELLKRAEHHHLHGEDEVHKAVSRISIEKARPYAAKWHSSAEGKKWHSEHAIENARNRKTVKKICAECGKEYEAKQNSSKFCSNACKTRNRYRTGIDNEERVCPECGKRYTVNRYAKKTYCSYECARKHRWGNAS